MRKAIFTPKPHKRDNGDGCTSDHSNNGKDPVNVYCRIRPLADGIEENCVQLESPTTLTIAAPADSKILRRDLQYTFKHIFTSYSSQKEIFDHIALPLLDDLLNGKSGLLFTYGITGSGKTYTLTGEGDNPGLMPRCIHTLFNTISESQAPKYVIKSDKMNGFEVQTENEALEDRKLDLKYKNRYQTLSKDKITYQNANMKVDNFNEANIYSVFITYIEIYNNFVYDLLDDSSPIPQTKILREDANKNMYVNGVCEVEVKSATEAFELFNFGQKRKRMAQTLLNAESSRSHSVFSIRVVQLLLTPNSQVIPEATLLKIGQLSLVDLAGSERSNRTQTTGARLKEASSINNSLMTLRNCMEILRDNQLNNVNRLVPYRESRLTHLFKNYFEGEGLINMIVCINPSTQDYEENLHVLKFAEISQEVKVKRAEGRYTPYSVKKRPPLVPKQAQTPRHLPTPINLFTPITFGPEIPNFKFDETDFEATSNNLKSIQIALEAREQQTMAWFEQFDERRESFRKELKKFVDDNVVALSEMTNLKVVLKKQKNKNQSDQTKIVQLENENVTWKTKVSEMQDVITTLQQTIDEKNLKINQSLLEREKNKKKFTKQQEKYNQELDDILRRQRQHLESKHEMNNARLQKVREIINSKTVCTNNETAVTADANVQTANRFDEPTTPSVQRSAARRNMTLTKSNTGKRRRSRSAGEVWLEHNVIKPVALSTVLQPSMKKRKSVTKLTKASDVTNPNQSKYCLLAQEPDVDGELETRLYKADIVPTCSGGAQVIFNDVECLKQESPGDRD